MNARKHIEQHANTLLAQILRGLGINVDAETKGHESHEHPDFLIDSGDKTIILEAEYDNRKMAEQDADRRLRGGFNPHIIGALSYSPLFEENVTQAIKDNTFLDFAFKPADAGEGGWEGRWRTGTVYDLAQALRRPHALSKLPYDEIAEAASMIAQALEKFSRTFDDKPGSQSNMVRILQASLPVAGKKREDAVKQSVHLAGLILTGAFLFHYALSERGVPTVRNPNEFEQSGFRVTEIEEHWQHILDNINYAAIFRIAIDLLSGGNVTKTPLKIIMHVARNVQGIARDGVDIMGVVYHNLLAELAKPLGAYYTTIPAATMLAALSLPLAKHQNIQWDNTEDIAKMRIADLACGSGTLLAAACGQVRDNAFRSYTERLLKDKKIPAGESAELQKMHGVLLENVIWGYDVLDTAVHLTATTLGLMAPEVDFSKSHIYRASVGVSDMGNALTGSFQLLESKQVTRKLFGDEESGVSHVETSEESADPLPELDLCIMNPPFVVGRKNALSYSFLPEQDVERVRNQMNTLAKRHGFSLAGLGPGFICLGEKYTKPGGRMAFIMSSTIATGRNKAWTQARQRVEKSCDLEHLILSREPGRSNFSYSTDLQECMFIARKRINGEKPKEQAMFSVLSENPQDADRAHAMARAILEAEKSGNTWGNLTIGGSKVGEFAFLRYRNAPWDGVAFANLRLTMAADMFADHGKLSPYSNSKGNSFIPVCLLDKLASFGSHHLHCHIDTPEIQEDKPRKLSFSKAPTEYAGYYPAHHNRVTGIAPKDIKHVSETPNCYFLPLPKHEKWAEKYFSRGGRIVINGSFRFNTVRRLASLISAPVQGANYQPVQLRNDTDARAKAMTLWLNSTPAILLFAVYSVYCEGAKVMFSQTAARQLPVLNLDKLSSKQIQSLARSFDKIAKMEFMPIPQLADDPAREAVDNALTSVLDLHDFDFNSLRKALAAEPIINGSRIDP